MRGVNCTKEKEKIMEKPKLNMHIVISVCVTCVCMRVGALFLLKIKRTEFYLLAVCLDVCFFQV